MTEIIIRQATTADLNILLRFEQNLINAERPFDKTLQSGPIHYYNIEAMIKAPHIELVVAQSNDTIIGCGYARIDTAEPYYAHKKYAYLGFMYVDPDYRGQGVNQQIIETLKQWVAAQHISEMRLDVYEHNVSAIKAYERAGFTKLKIEMRMNIQDK